MTKEKILEAFEEKFVIKELWGEQEMKFVTNISLEEVNQFISTSIDSLLQDVLSEADKYGDRLFNRCLVLEQERKENTNEYSNIRCELNGISQVKELIKSKSSSIN